METLLRAKQLQACRRRLDRFARPVVVGITLAMLAPGCSQTQTPCRDGMRCGLDIFASTFEGFMTRLTEFGYKAAKPIVYAVPRTNLEPAVGRAILERFAADRADLIIVLSQANEVVR